MIPIDHRVSPELRHVPLQPPRSGVPREGLFLTLWQQFATQRPDEWGYIFRFRTSGQIRQRAASVAASFMVFMGCNGGRSFTDSAARLIKSGAFAYAEDAYLAAWAIENKRLFGINGGLRTIEYMLSREYPMTGRPVHVDWKKVPDVSMDDMDIIESMVVWWGSSTTARLMRETVEATIKAHEASQRLQREAQFAVSMNINTENTSQMEKAA